MHIIGKYSIYLYSVKKQEGKAPK